MAEQEHVGILQHGVATWNSWRKQCPEITPDLSELSVIGLDLRGVDFSGTNLQECSLHSANFSEANLRGATFNGSRLHRANFRGADLTGATLDLIQAPNSNFANVEAEGAVFAGALLWFANFADANCRGAVFRDASLRATWLTRTDLTGAALEYASLVRTHMDDALMDGCRVYGASVWDLQGKPKGQSGLIITPDTEPTITVDDLKVAQFIRLLLTNQELRTVIDTVARKGVLILGRFSPEQKPVLDAIRLELRKHDYVPIMFDFEKPEGRSYTETVTTLAHLSRFVIADITDARLVLQELQAVMPGLPSVPVKVLTRRGTAINVVLADFAARCNFVQGLFEYDTEADATARLLAEVVQPAEAWIASARERAWHA